MDIKTKIVATLGPSSDSYETIKALLDAGLDLARINMSHGKWEEHKAKIDVINELRNDGYFVGIMMDLKAFFDKRICVAVSGGVDSVALLHYLKTREAEYG